MPSSAHTVRRLAAAIHYLESSLPAKLTLSMVADAAFCSKFHFHRLFAESMGMTVHTYLRRRRLTEAARALVFSKTPILHIALAAGYESQQAFAGVFAAMYKVPPGAFRKAASFYPLQLPAEFGEECLQTGCGCYGRSWTAFPVSKRVSIAKRWRAPSRGSGRSCARTADGQLGR